MKKQLYIALLAVIFGTAATLNASCSSGNCGPKKPRVEKRGCSSCKKQRTCSTGTCGR